MLFFKCDGEYRSKIGIRPKPLRSRVLMLVPLVAFVYMFLCPFIYRVLKDQAGGSNGRRAYALFTGLLNLALLGCMVWLFNKRWRVSQTD